MNDPLTKLYAGLTDEERAVLAFTYRAGHNDLEVARIESAMIDQTFSGAPYEYRRMTAGMYDMALLYAVEYWKQVALCLTMQAGTMALIHDPDPEAYLPLRKAFETAEGVLLAVEQAFADVCLEHRLDIAAMQFVSGKRFYEIATPDLKPDDACVAGYREVFEGALDMGGALVRIPRTKMNGKILAQDVGQSGMADSQTEEQVQLVVLASW